MDYFIAHFPRENERALFKTDGENKLWLRPDNSWSRDERWARRFLHEDSAVWCLITIRQMGEPEVYQPKAEKQSWGEYSSD